ncbi:DUF4157 domain-containing protein [Planktothrix agardhii 1806]|uniref:eCIS core domain-containing protein n=1 Tax=Planktothrix agardhii TaxID=1160 RepID=UPI001F2326D9|nr:DUF4157 domain-containing protein [Planktothrix agardhii]MCF3570853.1 DUF4157 domain-containing protein [Planktothrix agardhii 1805]MCF3586101.1 DUF4157 domain-containing protein [Planktothrix agardhii 1803]MCF3616161.1 DUF4157 domain-containing protein [Planktothrix agardhii 1806]
MKVRLKKQNRHEVESVNQTGIQAKYLTDIRPMDNALAAPQKHQTEDINHQQIQKKPGFNFAEIPITGNTDRSTSRIQPKFNLSLQKKLTVGEAGDKYEQEADSVAEKVVKKINTPSGEQSTSGQGVQRQEEEDLQMKPDISSIQRQEGEEEDLQMKPDISSIQRQEGEEEDLQMKPDISSIQRQEGEEEEIQAKSTQPDQQVMAGGDASTELETSIQTAKGGGQPLDGGLQRSMGQAMGADFSGVKVHTDSQSDQLNQSIQAKAFTTGQDVFFRQGAYEPSSRGGQELIAHELTHVVQQNGGAVQRSPEIQRDGEETPVATKTPKEAALETINRNKKYKERFAQELRKMVKRKIPEGEMALIWQRFSSAMKRHEVLLPRWNEINWGKDSERAKAVDVTEIQLAKLEAFRQDIEFLTELVETDQGEELQINNVTLWSDIKIGRPAANNPELNKEMSVAKRLDGGTPLNKTSMGALLDLFAVGATEGDTPDLKNVNGDLLLNDNNPYMQWGGSFNVWAAVSANFAAKATGEVHVYVPTGTGTGSVFWTAELPELRKNPAVTSIFIHELSSVGKDAVAQEKAKTIDQMEMQTILKSPQAWTTSTISGLKLNEKGGKHLADLVQFGGLTVTGAGGGQGISAGKLKNMGNKWKGYKKPIKPEP